MNERTDKKEVICLSILISLKITDMTPIYLLESIWLFYFIWPV